MKTTLRIVAALAAASLAGLCFAPIVDPRELKATPEHSQEQLAQQQRMNGTLPVVGEVPRDTEITDDVSESESAKGASALASTENKQKATKVLQSAQKDLKREETKGARTLWLLLGALAVAALAVVGIRQWANKAAPEFPSRPEPEPAPKKNTW